MIDEQVVQLARDRIRLEISEQRVRLEKDIGRVKAEASARGVLNSGITLVRIATLCADAARDRAQIAWQTVHRFVTTAGIRYYDGLAQELKSLVDEFLPSLLPDLRGYPSEEARRMGSANLIEQLQEMVDSGRAAAVAKIHNEIDLFVVSLRSRPCPTGDRPDSPTFNIYSPVGSIQTGANAVSYVTQTIDAATRQKLTEALNAIERDLSAIDALPSHPKAEVAEVVEEAKKELAKLEPNSTKLRSLLSTTATAIQTVASMKPAYELLKAGLAYLGITVP